MSCADVVSVASVVSVALGIVASVVLYGVAQVVFAEVDSMDEVLSKCCQCCGNVDSMLGVHPMRCRAPELRATLPVSVMRADSGLCGPEGSLWKPKHADAGGEH